MTTYTDHQIFEDIKIGEITPESLYDKNKRLTNKADLLAEEKGFKGKNPHMVLNNILSPIGLARNELEKGMTPLAEVSRVYDTHATAFARYFAALDTSSDFLSKEANREGFVTSALHRTHLDYINSRLQEEGFRLEDKVA